MIFERRGNRYVRRARCCCVRCCQGEQQPPPPTFVEQKFEGECRHIGRGRLLFVAPYSCAWLSGLRAGGVWVLPERSGTRCKNAFEVFGPPKLNQELKSCISHLPSFSSVHNIVCILVPQEVSLFLPGPKRRTYEGGCDGDDDDDDCNTGTLALLLTEQPLADGPASAVSRNNNNNPLNSQQVPAELRAYLSRSSI